MANEEEEEYGKHFGKPDLHRFGFFDDAPPGPFDEYQPPLQGTVRSCLVKGPQMSSGTDKKTPFFETEFKRIFTGEALPELGQPPNKKKEKEKKLGVIKPPGTTKWHSTAGDAFGCFSKHPKSFSPQTKPEPEEDGERKASPLMKTKPSPFGGPGYVDICINPYVPMYLKREPYDLEYKPVPQFLARLHKRNFVSQCKPSKYFDENPYRQLTITLSSGKRTGKKKKVRRGAAGTNARPHFQLYFAAAPLGPLSGCFWPFPRHLPDPPDYQMNKKKKRGRKSLEPLRPAGGPSHRSKYSASVVELVTRIACNLTNFTDYREQVYPLM